MKMIYQIPEVQISEMESSMCILEDSGEIGAGNEGGDDTPPEPGILSNQNQIFDDGVISSDANKSGLWE